MAVVSAASVVLSSRQLMSGSCTNASSLRMRYRAAVVPLICSCVVEPPQEGS
jgi:hypothetical protein